MVRRGPLDHDEECDVLMYDEGAICGCDDEARCPSVVEVPEVKQASPPADHLSPDTTGHPDCPDCKGDRLWSVPGGGRAQLCGRCRSCCECYCGEPFLSDVLPDLYDW
jgi:hypothetical protein